MSTPEVGSPPSARGFLGQPRGLLVLCVTEALERFSQYGIQGILVLFLIGSEATGGLGMATAEATSVFGIYVAIVYLLSMPGGMIADRITGLRKAVLVGAALILIGCVTMAFPDRIAIWPGLMLVAIGTGLLKPNISALVGELYGDEESGGRSRDVGYSIFFVAVNIGAFVAFLVCGFVGRTFGWHVGFAVAGMGIAIGMLVFVSFAHRSLGRIGTTVTRPLTRSEHLRLIRIAILAVCAAGVVIGLLAVTGVLSVELIVVILAVMVVLVPVGYFVRLGRELRGRGAELRRVQGFMWVFTAAVCFWMIASQMGSTLIIFSENHASRYIGDYHFPASWERAADPVTIILLSPLFVMLWMRLGDRGPSVPAKFAAAIFLVGASFLAMGVLSMMAEDGLIGWGWLAGVICVQAVAAILLSPAGLAASSRLSPTGRQGEFLALWFLTVATGFALGGQLARLKPMLGDARYFSLLGALVIGLAGVLALGSKRLQRLMNA